MRADLRACCKSFAKATNRHRILTAIALAALYLVLEYVLQMHQAAKVTEVFGLAPFADRALMVLLGE